MKIEIEISDNLAASVNGFLERHDPDSQSNTHGTLDIAGLAKMLLEDVALAVRRPGSRWGQQMGALLASHGYKA